MEFDKLLVISGMVVRAWAALSKAPPCPMCIELLSFLQGVGRFLLGYVGLLAKERLSSAQ